MVAAIVDCTKPETKNIEKKTKTERSNIRFGLKLTEVLLLYLDVHKREWLFFDEKTSMLCVTRNGSAKCARSKVNNRKVLSIGCTAAISVS